MHKMPKTKKMKTKRWKYLIMMCIIYMKVMKTRFMSFRMVVRNILAC